MIRLSELNEATSAEFVALLTGIFEHSPWVAERAASARPFRSRFHLHEVLQVVVADASRDEQLALIRAHPELGGNLAARGELTVASAREQKGAGLADCSPEQLARLRALNAEYVERFGFPFVLAVRGHNTASIIASLEQRVRNDADSERAVALSEIGRIAGFRLADLVEEPLGSQILAMCDSLAQFSEQEQGLTCSYLTPAHRQTAAQLREWMLAAGLETEVDALGNVVGRLQAEDEALSLLTGSHYDTVVNAGRYDGRLGIVLPIAVAAELRREGVRLPFSLEIIAFAEEEGVRFKSTFLGSSAVAGRFNPGVLDSIDTHGLSLRQAMQLAGLDPESIGAVARDPSRLLGFVEVHIEQGPVLLSEGLPLGVVTSIAGSVRAIVTVTGLAGHAGTVPMRLRRDAAAAAAEIVLIVESRCAGVEGVVGTVGQLHVPDGAVNVIPGRCELSIDIRSDEDAARRAAYDDVIAAIDGIAERRKVEIEVRKVLEIGATPCAPKMQARWAQSIRSVTGSSEVRHLPSGAGHDAMMMAAIAPVGMLFVRCGNGGISHHPSESLTERDAELAARAFKEFLMDLSSSA